MNPMYVIARKDLLDLFGRLAQDSRVIVPYGKKDRYSFADFDPAKEDSIELAGIRQSQPVKSFISTPRERVVGPKDGPGRPLVIAGVKACDLRSFDLQDFVFAEGDFCDPEYVKMRTSTTIIACDCSYAKETCFCVAMEGAPYPSKHYDIGLSQIGGSFLVEVASEKGKALIGRFGTFFRAPDAVELGTRTMLREKVSGEVRGHIEKRGTPPAAALQGAVKKQYYNTQLWQDFASTCVECGACNLACPTCHCFLLFDEKAAEGPRRARVWDSCLYSTFARVAGGHNPRTHLYERLRNRFDKKFDFFPQVMKSNACTGCGRCIDGCAGDIDIREVLKGIVSGEYKKPPHE